MRSIGVKKVGLDEIFEEIEEVELIPDMLKKSEEVSTVIDNIPEIEFNLRIVGKRMLSMNKAIIELRERAEGLEGKMIEIEVTKSIIMKSVNEVDLMPLNK